MDAIRSGGDVFQVLEQAIPLIIIIAIIIAISRKQDISANTKGISFSNILSFLNPKGILLNLTLKNPKLIEQIISPEVKDRSRILKEIKKIKMVKEIKKLDENRTDILVTFEDNSDHWYQAQTKDNKILNLGRYS